MNFYKNYAIYITSIEIDDKGKADPVLTHITWGDTIEEALAIMESHVISDYFLAATFLGEMTWRDSILHLTYDRAIRGKTQQLALEAQYKYGNMDVSIIQKLKDAVTRISKLQQAKRLPEIINEISKSK